MNRAILLFALAGLVGGCYSKPDRGDVTLYWDFLRHKLDGSTVVYDSNIFPTTSGTTCTESGIDIVVVTFDDGTTSGAIDCVVQGAQGATFSRFRGGTHQFVVTGYAPVGNTSVALYESTVSVDVITGRNTIAPTVDVAGIPGDLEVNARFLDATGSTQFASCADARVQTLTFNLVDFAGTSVASGQVSCTDPAGVSFLAANSQALDLDEYSIRMQAFETGTPSAVFDSSTAALSPPCVNPTFGHYGTDVGSAAWVVNLYDVTHNTTLCR